MGRFVRCAIKFFVIMEFAANMRQTPMFHYTLLVRDKVVGSIFSPKAGGKISTAPPCRGKLVCVPLLWVKSENLSIDVFEKVKKEED